MLASVRTRTRIATTPHLRWLAGRRTHSNPSFTCLPRCSFRQLSSGRVWRSPPELAFGTSAAPFVINSLRFLCGVWLKFSNNVQTAERHRAAEKHSPSEQTTDTTRHRSIGRFPTVSQIQAVFPPRTRELILLPTRHMREHHPTLKIFAEDKPELPSGVNVWSPGALR